MNPYLDEIEERLPALGFMESFQLRQELVSKYSWAILKEPTLQALGKLGPILSVGSGNGYNEWLLQKRGVDVIASDIKKGSFDEPDSDIDPPWTEILELEASEAVRQYGVGRTLFVCWPSYGDPWAAGALLSYPGDTVAYVGEGYGGCTADDEFHEILEIYWELVDYLEIPQWNGLHDSLHLYKRKK